MLKNIAVADPFNLANTAITGITDASNIISSSNYITALDPTNYYDFKCGDISNSFIIADVPTIFTIVSTEICGPKLVRIKYTVANPQLNTLFESGNIYINSGIFGIYNSSDNFYWKNEVIIEVESEEYINKIQPEMKFTNATQWEKKLTIAEVVNMVNNPFEYYKYVHKIVEQYVHDKPQSIRIAKHQEIDKLYGLE